MKQTKQEQEKEYIEGAEIKITQVECNTDNGEEIKKIIFTTNKGNITYKPKMLKEEFREGIKMNMVKPCSFESLPNIIKQIAKTCQQKGTCLVNVAYNVWNTEKDGMPVTYRFISGVKTLSKWVIVGDEIVVEEKVL